MVNSNIIDQYYNGDAALRDAIKTLNANIRFLSVDRAIKSLVITSVAPHEGKSTIAVLLGIAMAESQKRTLLMECDCRRPVLSGYLQLHPKYDLIHLLGKKVTVEEAVVPTKVPNLSFLSGLTLPCPVEILGSNRFVQLLNELEKQFDTIILDTPPLGSFIESAILASVADGALLVVECGGTDIAAAQDVVAQLRKANADLLGVVLNKVNLKYSDRYYAEYYHKEKPKKRPAERFPADIIDEMKKGVK